MLHPQIFSIREYPERRTECIDFLVSFFTNRTLMEQNVSDCLHTDGPLPQGWFMWWENRVVGWVGLLEKEVVVRDDISPWISPLLVAKDRRGHRYGEALLNHASHEAAKLGFDRVYLTTDHIGYYEKYGFKEIGLTTFTWGRPTKIYQRDTQNACDSSFPLSAPTAWNFSTERLILRAFTESDFDAVHRYASDPENVRFMLFDPNTEDVTRGFIKHAMKTAAEKPVNNYQFAVTLKDTGALIGGCEISTENQFNDGTAEVGWMLNRQYWKQGYATEFGTFLLQFGFTELGCHRIIARCDAENTGSYRVMERIGMRREGRFIEGRRSNGLMDYTRRDELAYAILAEEWHTQREIEYYNTLPVTFDNFIDFPPLTDGTVTLVCVKKSPANPEIKHVPQYHFEIRKADTNEKAGEIGLRIGYTDGLYYGGQIGYAVDEPHRGQGYAVRACQLLAPVLKAHDMHTILITNNHTNTASMRVCEKLGAKKLRVARLPEWHDLYREGQRFENIYAWDAY